MIKRVLGGLRVISLFFSLTNDSTRDSVSDLKSTARVQQQPVAATAGNAAAAAPVYLRRPLFAAASAATMSMQSWQLQGAACCGITRGLHRACGGGAHDIAFTLKAAPSDFCVNEVSIKGVVADVSAIPAGDETALSDAAAGADSAAAAPLVTDDDGLQGGVCLGGADASCEVPSAVDDACPHASSSSPAKSSADILSSCFAVDTEWSSVHAALSAIAPTFFSNPKPHSLFSPQSLLLSDAALTDKPLRKRAYNIVRSLFPFVSLTTPSPPG